VTYFLSLPSVSDAVVETEPALSLFDQLAIASTILGVISVSLGVISIVIAIKIWQISNKTQLTVMHEQAEKLIKEISELINLESEKKCAETNAGVSSGLNDDQRKLLIQTVQSCLDKAKKRGRPDKILAASLVVGLKGIINETMISELLSCWRNEGYISWCEPLEVSTEIAILEKDDLFENINSCKS
jgi:hypothetical protein